MMNVDNRPMGALKLFVLGERSPNPDEWDMAGEIAIVMAHDSEEALRMYPLQPATEISISESMVLCVIPNYGADD